MEKRKRNNQNRARFYNFVSVSQSVTCSRNQNAGQHQNVKIHNKSLERVEELRYLGSTLTNRNSIHEEIKSRLKSGNACCQSVQNLLSSRLLSKNTKIRVYRTVILPVFCMGVKRSLSH
jgi:hypothetical protein